MENKEFLEEAISNIKEDYIEECLEYTSEKKTNPSWMLLTSKVALFFLIIVSAGTATAIAASQIYKMKETKFAENAIYFGDYDSTLDIEADETAIVIESGSPISVDTKQSEGDEELWLDKTVETYENGESITKYNFPNYEKAIEYFEINSNFVGLPGNVESVTASHYSKVDKIEISEKEWYTYDLSDTTIASNFQFGEGTFNLVEHYVVGAVAQNAYLVQDLYEAENERNFINKNGIEFTLVDGYESENKKNKITMVLLNSDHYFGEITFKEMKEQDIQTVLNCFDIIYVAN